MKPSEALEKKNLFIYNGRTPEQRFWDRVNKKDSNSCWKWTGTKHKNGYGYSRFYGKIWYTHRLSFYINNGYIVKGMCVCHKCDNPICVNPNHLYLGTQKENIHDAIIKGRNALGEKNGLSKLSEKNVIEIIELYINRLSQRAIAKKYGISQMLVSMIVTRKIWKHLKISANEILEKRNIFAMEN